MSKVLNKIKIIKYVDGVKNDLEDVVASEHRVSIIINDEHSISTMCIPEDQDAYAVGFLISEGIIKNLSEVENITIDDSGDKVYIKANISEENLRFLYKDKTITSSSCVGALGNVRDVVRSHYMDSKLKIEPKLIIENLKTFHKDSVLFSQTGCIHKASVLANGKLISCEDVGRHNAVDKVLGKAKLLGMKDEDSVLFASCRLSLEMVLKTIMHNIPIIVSKASPTMNAIELANECGLTLIAFARGESMNIYTHPDRIL